MNDIELGPEEKSLIATARYLHVPSEVQCARVRKGLDAKLAAGVAAPLLASSTALAMAGKIGAGVALVAVVGAGTAYVVTDRPAQEAPPAQAHHQAAPVARTAAPTPDPLPTAAEAAETSPLGDSRPVATHPKSSTRRREANPPLAVDLAGELALLTQVNAAIKRNDVDQAGELLRTYDQRFPSGKLAEERSAAGILVLCAAGRTQSARSEARRFVERWPRSPLVVRISSSCAAEGKTP